MISCGLFCAERFLYGAHCLRYEFRPIISTVYTNRYLVRCSFKIVRKHSWKICDCRKLILTNHEPFDEIHNWAPKVLLHTFVQFRYSDCDFNFQFLNIKRQRWQRILFPFTVLISVMLSYRRQSLLLPYHFSQSFSFSLNLAFHSISFAFSPGTSNFLLGFIFCFHRKTVRPASMSRCKRLWKCLWTE